jgi:hypothetical protein
VSPTRQWRICKGTDNRRNIRLYRDYAPEAPTVIPSVRRGPERVYHLNHARLG